MRIFKRHSLRRRRFNLLTRGGWFLVIALFGLTAAGVIALWLW